ncbi:nuclear pore complex protein Nup50-like [Eriocheir sinensis]|uniref:nuclear pore complex protein Nup50-like n=1 Tax=Eriocheir sinensis TaxID=95602 RepID=UPI0021C914F9|nr:nuclear pore complex protein Nup50-like [Eriocheir sinensis]XP_050737561.1 nuclear pore complex protein Nup50-like [Eriocheir sinensis]XP_050737562.1 nuclear pore complex protein Nup50-like [Eriocheir sinensis]XP_050737563.1 nuclear pore complex protein Nup50-like [Eriocheir sinensis]XP_050737564.1 nuclear pore complex protein Nup50-like [Eriocheir sinensis]
MAKRGAVKELTHDNWEEEDDPEDMGVFRQAPTSELANRQIKKARRRGGNLEESSSPGIFKGLTPFTGFGGNKESSSVPTFSFINKDTGAKPTFDILGTSKANTPTSFTKSDATSPEKKASLPTFKFTTKDSSTNSPKSVESKTNGMNPSKTNTDPSGKKGNKEFLGHLKALNEGVVKWVKQHLDANPHVNLSPVFDDYKKHFEELTKKYPSSGESENEETGTESEASGKDQASEKENQPIATKPTFSFASSVTSSSEKSLFGASSASSDKKTAAVSPTKPAFSFGGFGKSAPEKSLFSGGGNSIFGGLSSSTTTATSSTTTTATTTGNTGADKDDAAYEPPKVEVSEVKEEDAIYEKKCKLFYMKDGAYVEKGVGTLFLKPAGEKTQLLIRALTNLGNILLNIILNPTIPTARAGKNGVIIACIPNPPVSGSGSASNEPVKMLIRVKTGEDADALMEKINELKK